jgi:transposase
MTRTTTSHATRVVIVERHLEGETLRKIAEDMELSYYTIRKWWRIYLRDGWKGLEPKPQGPPQVGTLGKFSPLVKYVALRLKRQCPGWGVDKLLLEMSRRPSLEGQKLPKRSSLASYLSQFGGRLQRPRQRPTRRPKVSPGQNHEPHQCWQIDFKGDEVVGGCEVAIAPFMLCDEASGAPLMGVIHQVRAKGQRTGLSVRSIQANLRQGFMQWGLPDAIRTDRDPLFVGSGRLQWPGTLQLWFVGLGIKPIINRAYRPTDNAIVERNHWTWEQHVLLGRQYERLEDVQEETNRSFADRREMLPSRHRGCNGRPFVEAFPALNEPRRRYVPEEEPDLFDLKRVDAYLAQWEWRRVVDSMGKISLAGRNFYVGKPHRKQVVKLRFDQKSREMVCQLVGGTEIARLTLHEFSPDYILGTVYGSEPDEWV